MWIMIELSLFWLWFSGFMKLGGGAAVTLELDNEEC